MTIRLAPFQNFTVPLSHVDDDFEQSLHGQDARSKTGKWKRAQVASHLKDQSSHPKRIGKGQKTTQSFFFPILDAILVIGQRTKDILEVSNLQRREALFGEAQGQLVTQLF